MNTKKMGSEFIVFLSDSEESTLIQWEEGVPKEVQQKDFLNLYLNEEIKSFMYMNDTDTKAQIDLFDGQTLLLEIL